MVTKASFANIGHKPPNWVPTSNDVPSLWNWIPSSYDPSQIGGAQFGGNTFGGLTFGGGDTVAPVGQNDPVGTGGPNLDPYLGAFAQWLAKDSPKMDHVNPATQTGWEQLNWRNVDALGNAVNSAKDFATGKWPTPLQGPAAELGFKLGHAAREALAPVGENASAWLGKTGKDYQDWRKGQQAKAAPAAAPTAFSPTGESAFLAYMAPRENSTGNPAARNPNSSAMGNHQFIEQTWLGVIKQHGASAGLGSLANVISKDAKGRWTAPAEVKPYILGLRANPQISAQMAEAHGGDLAAGMASALGRQPTPAETYIAWFLGSPAAAAAIVKMDPNAKVGSVVGTDAIKANPSVFPNGADTTVAQFRAKLDRSGGSSGGSGSGRVLAEQTTQLPGPPPTLAAPIPTDFSRTDAAFQALKPDGADLEFARRQGKDLWLSALAQGVSSTEGGIPGMLARMAAGGFAAQAKGKEFERQEMLRAKADERDWEKAGFNYELTKAETRGREANAGIDRNFKNASAAWDYKTKLAGLNQMQVGPMGTLETMEVGPDGKAVRRILDVGSELVAFRQSLGLGGSNGLGGGGSGKLGLPDRVEKTFEMYNYARMRTAQGAPGGDALFWGAFADEVANSPYKFDILGVDSKRYQGELAKAMAATGGDAKAAEVNLITAKLVQAAKADPNGTAQLLNRAAGHGLLGPLMAREQQ